MRPFLLFIFIFISTTESVTFKCTTTKSGKCQSLAGYFSANATTLSSLQSLFNVPSLPSLLGANNLPLSTKPSHLLPPNSTLRIPFPCSCNASSSTGASDRTPLYTVRPSDTGLDFIARTVFLQFVTYQEIAAANNITNPDVIVPGEKLYIPLPCSCDPVDGGNETVVHMAHIVAAGSSLEKIASDFGTHEDLLMKLNGITDPKLLQAGQVLDVPLHACSSSISSQSLDHGLLLPNGSYALTAANCIQCSCSCSSSSSSSSSSKYQLSCNPIQGLNSTVCPVTKCSGGLYIGNSTSSGCNQTTCAYQGFTNSTGLNILSGLTTQSTCNAQPPASSQPGGNSPPNSACRLGLHSVGGIDYGSVRIGTFMGRKIIKFEASALVSSSLSGKVHPTHNRKKGVSLKQSSRMYQVVHEVHTYADPSASEKREGTIVKKV